MADSYIQRLEARAKMYEVRHQALEKAEDDDRATCRLRRGSMYLTTLLWLILPWSAPITSARVAWSVGLGFAVYVATFLPHRAWVKRRMHRIDRECPSPPNPLIGTGDDNIG